MKKDSESKKTYSKTFFLLAGASIAGIMGGIYYIYTLFKNEPFIRKMNLKLKQSLKNIIKQESYQFIMRSKSLRLLIKLVKISSGKLNLILK